MIISANAKNQTARLGDVARFIRGITFKPEDIVEPSEDGAVVCMRTKNVQKDLDQEDIIAVPTKFVRREDLFLRESDILVSTANSWNLVGKCCWVPPLDYDATAGGFISILRAEPTKVFPRYLYYWFNSETTQRSVRHCGRATTNISNMSFERCESIMVPLPPLSEQKRIADILDKADAIRRKRQEGVFNFDLLSDSLFNQLSHDFHIQPQFVEALIDSQILLVHKDGNFGGSYPRKHEFGLDGIPFLSAKHVAPDGTLSKEDVPRLNEEKARTLPFGWVERGDVLLAHNATVGPVALYGGDYKEALIGTSLTCYRPNPFLLKSEFLFAALRGSHFQRQLAKAMSQTTRNQVPITAQRKLTLHIPPLDQQLFFSEQLSVIRTLRTKHVKAASEADTLFNSLVQRAFKGEL